MYCFLFLLFFVIIAQSRNNVMKTQCLDTDRWCTTIVPVTGAPSVIVVCLTCCNPCDVISAERYWAGVGTRFNNLMGYNTKTSWENIVTRYWFLCEIVIYNHEHRTIRRVNWALDNKKKLQLHTGTAALHQVENNKYTKSDFYENTHVIQQIKKNKFIF